MLARHAPKWLRFLAKHLGWLAVPNIAILLVTLQALGFLFVLLDPAWGDRLALIPELVLRGELWRVFTFLALPVTMSPLWVVFQLLFLYFIVNSIEAEWGAFQTTLYVLVSVVLTNVFSLVTGYPVTEAADFSSSLFLAAAALFPEQEIRLYMIVPVKMKYLGWLALAFFGWRLLVGSWLQRFYLLTIYSNYLLFFGPALFENLKQWQRRRAYRGKFR